MPPDPQSPVLDFLGDARNHGGVPVTRIDTSCACIFLAGDRAYKIKRAVNLDYLDFTGFEARLKACAAELALNQPGAPMLYQRLAMVTRDAQGRLALDGAGVPVEPVVVMARFADQALGTVALARGTIDRPMVEALGRRLRRYHADCAVAPMAADAMERRVEQCLAAARLMIPDIAAGRIEALADGLHAAFDAVAGEIRQRAAAGYWRRGHGDLHLGNICVIGGVLVPFDALEFDDALASGDVLYDLAFLVMDLRRLGRADLALALFDAYDDRVPGGGDAMPAFVALRALIRAFVTHAAWRAAPAGPPAPVDAIGSFLAQAENSLADRQQRLIAIGGLSGTGKSTLARALAPLVGPVPGALHLRSDTIRKRLAGVADEERLPPEAYTPESSGAVYQAMKQQAGFALGLGRSVILDAVFAKPEERALVRTLAGVTGLPLTGLWLEVALDTRQARIADRRGDASDATPAVAAAQEGYALGMLDWQRLDAGGGIDAVLARSQAALH